MPWARNHERTIKRTRIVFIPRKRSSEVKGAEGPSVSVFSVNEEQKTGCLRSPRLPRNFSRLPSFADLMRVLVIFLKPFSEAVVRDILCARAYVQIIKILLFYLFIFKVFYLFL